MAKTAPYKPAIGDRVRIGSGKAVWIIEDFPTLTNGATVAAPSPTAPRTRE